MLHTTLAILALSWSTLFAGATPISATQLAAVWDAAVQQMMGPNWKNAMMATAQCSASSGFGINMDDCFAATRAVPAEIIYTPTWFGYEAGHDPNFRLPKYLWYGSCGIVIGATRPPASVRINYVTIFVAIGELGGRCAQVSRGNGMGGVIDAGAMRIAIVNPATMAPQLKQTWDLCLGMEFGVNVPTGCASSADYFTLVNTARGNTTQ